MAWNLFCHPRHIHVSDKVIIISVIQRGENWRNVIFWLIQFYFILKCWLSQIIWSRNSLVLAPQTKQATAPPPPPVEKATWLHQWVVPRTPSVHLPLRMWREVQEISIEGPDNLQKIQVVTEVLLERKMENISFIHLKFQASKSWFENLKKKLCNIKRREESASGAEDSTEGLPEKLERCLERRAIHQSRVWCVVVFFFFHKTKAINLVCFWNLNFFSISLSYMN